MEKIDISKCPKDKPAKIFYPDGELIVETDNPIVFEWIRLQIKEQQLSGCYIEFEDYRLTIDRNGTLSDYPEGLFDTYQKILIQLI